ncbi:MAG: HAD family hydrolase [Planctomycetota bacterium]|nr:HAD family hydrolase [Planctomycetota bacterium]
MNQSYLRIIKKFSQPQTPLPTDMVSRLRCLKEVKAVFFDIYGTLFISCSGDIGVPLPGVGRTSTAGPYQETPKNHLAGVLGKRFFELFSEGLNESCSPLAERLVGLQTQTEDTYPLCGELLMESFRSQVKKVHQIRKQEGFPWPEVDVRHIWQSLLGESHIAANGHDRLIDQWAIEYEVRINPVWPMPNANDCIDQLGSAKLTLGIISNAQFYTPLLFPALLDKQLEDLEIASEMQYYSYRCGRAKPDPWMYQRASEALAQIGIIPSQTLYVGNDMRNDILPASQIGFRTALVATDRRSLRLREGDPGIAHVTPDLVVTNLSDLVDCVLG